MVSRFRNRQEAGQRLAKQLTAYRNRPDVLVLALPRGGVPVAFEVALALNLPLDICLVRKLGVPGQKELAMGAIAPGGVRVLNTDVVQWMNISEETLDQVAAQEQQELERRDRTYRGNLQGTYRPAASVRDLTIILVDDGIATGSTLRAAIATLRQQHPQQIVVAVPVAPPVICEALEAEVDQCCCLLMPESLASIGAWYQDFSQTTDHEVRTLLEQAAARSIIGSPS